MQFWDLILAIGLGGLALGLLVAAFYVLAVFVWPRSEDDA